MRGELFRLLLHISLVVASPWLDSISSNNTLFTWEDTGSDLPIGTYITTGVSGIIKLAEYLADRTDVEIRHLLISDSTIEDVDTRHGFRTMSLFEYDDWGDVVEKKLTPEEEEAVQDARRHNAQVELRLRQAVCDSAQPLQRVLDKALPSLQTFSFLTYIAHFPSDIICDESPDAEDPRLTALRGRVYPSLQHLTIRFAEPPEWSEELGPLNYGTHFPAVTHYHTVLPDQRGAHSLAAYLTHFHHLTHLRITGLTGNYQLPAEIRMASPTLPESRLGETQQIPYTDPVPSDLTVIVQPGFNPLFYGGWCGTPGVEYDELFRTLEDPPHLQIPPALDPSHQRMIRPRLHVRFPLEADYRTYGGERGVFPLRRAIAEFEEGVRGGDGEWAVPGLEPSHSGQGKWWEKADRNRDEAEL